ncbi:MULTISPECIES: hypothetical protein [unclassified Halomonas]|uniref:hypothetical protein n=1 Tax=unclassified Halomonas TaxID=2609666 RepID=UPI001C9580C9|nr:MULTISPECIES: hypothetical protein [unclassified Halomonas]MBY5925397.1 hypothetical protein [Halomonas sp. DP4Y7-2]MBY6232785.1 hypothetical protein [Halomonas sp. DP4Y7-1]
MLHFYVAVLFASITPLLSPVAGPFASIGIGNINNSSNKGEVRNTGACTAARDGK